MVLPHHQNAEQSHCLQISNKPFENVAEFRHLGTTVTNQNFIHEEIKSRLNMGNAFLPFCSESFFVFPSAV
jgi:hypothetical protein